MGLVEITSVSYITFCLGSIEELRGCIPLEPFGKVQQENGFLVHVQEKHLTLTKIHVNQPGNWSILWMLTSRQYHIWSPWTKSKACVWDVACFEKKHQKSACQQLCLFAASSPFSFSATSTVFVPHYYWCLSQHQEQKLMAQS